MALDNNELFDVEFYLGANPDVAKAVTEGLWKSAIEHFTDYGRFEKRDPSLLFQTQFYLDGNSDVAAELASSRLDYALKHFTKHGQYEQRDPSIFFNTKFYLDTNSDVAKAVAEGSIESAIQHFTLFGMFEGRNPSNLYNNQFYLDSNPDVKAAVTAGQFRSGFDHFMEFGFNEGRIGATRAKLAFSAAEFRVIEDGTPVVAVTIDRTDGNIGEVSATVSLSNGTATAPEDYNNTPIEVKFASGETQKTVLIPIVNDNLVEGNETVNLTLGSPQNGATIGEQNTAVLRILDNDGSTVLSRTAGTILSDDSIDVFLPPGGELTLEVTVTVPGDGSTPAAVSVSPSSFGLKKAAKLASGDTSTPEITFAATAAPPQLPLDVFLLQDLSGSFDDDLPKLRELVPNLIPALKTRQPDTTFGFGSFIDKPIDPFGINGDYVYSLNQTQTTDSTQLEQQVDRITVLDEASGADSPEAQLEALLQIARRTVASNENGFRNGARHVVVVSTDASYHIEGDGVQANITLPNNGDTIIDPQEDYPNVGQVRQALIDADIVPIFAVTQDEIRDNIPTYNNLVNQLGFGKVVKLESDSRNLVDAITEGLGAVGSEINIFSVSDDFGYVKEILPAKFTGVLAGETRTFTVKLKSDGRGGDDSLILRALGYGDTKVNIRTSDDNTIDTAFILGELTGGLTIHNSVGGNDTADYYKFTINSPSTFGLLLSGLTENADVELLNSDGTTRTTVNSQYKFDKDKDTKDKTDSEKIYASSLPAGTYYIKVSPGKDANSKYDLNVSAIPENTGDLLPVLSPNGIRFDGIVSNKGEKRVVSIRTPDGSPRKYIQNVPTWIVIHGLNDSPDSSGNIGKLAKVIEDKGGQVLVVDWSNAAASFTFGIPDPGPASEWIHDVADFAVRALKEWGIDSKNINLVGHSLGTYVSSEIGFVFASPNPNDRAIQVIDQKRINTFTALDPAGFVNFERLFAALQFDGRYDLDGDTGGIQEPLSFSNVSTFSRALYGLRVGVETDSVRIGDGLGSPLYAHSATESFRVRFNSFNPIDNHGNIVQLFTNMLEQTNTPEQAGLISYLFELGDYENLELRKDAYDGDEGILVVTNSENKPDLLVTKDAKSSDDEIVYGSTGDDKLDGSNILGLGGSGDPLYTGSGNDKFYGDAGNDVIVGDSGNDTIYGNQGNDTLYGNQDADLIYGGKNDDVIYGGQGNDILFGDQGSDFLNGDLGDDVLYGGDDKDQDTLTGGLGNDVFILKLGNGLPTSDPTNIDKVDIIKDFRKGVPVFPVGGVDVRGVSRIGLIDGLKREQIGVQFIGNLLDTFGQKTVISANREYLAVLNGGWFSQSDLQLTELPLS